MHKINFVVFITIGFFIYKSPLLRNVLSVVRFFVFLVFTNVGGRGMPDPALKLWDGRVELFILRTNLRKDLSDNLYFCETMPD
jgi:hypothetical protein